MPFRDADHGHTRLLPGLTWAAAGSAAVAALVTLIGGSDTSIRFAVLLLTVFAALVAAVLLMRADPALIRIEVEERVAAEVGALRTEFAAALAGRDREWSADEAAGVAVPPGREWSADDPVGVAVPSGREWESAPAAVPAVESWRTPVGVASGRVSVGRAAYTEHGSAYNGHGRFETSGSIPVEPAPAARAAVPAGAFPAQRAGLARSPAGAAHPASRIAPPDAGFPLGGTSRADVDARRAAAGISRAEGDARRAAAGISRADAGAVRAVAGVARPQAGRGTGAVRPGPPADPEPRTTSRVAERAPVGDRPARPEPAHPAGLPGHDSLSHPAGLPGHDSLSHPAGLPGRDSLSHPAGLFLREQAHPAGPHRSGYEGRRARRRHRAADEPVTSFFGDAEADPLSDAYDWRAHS